MKKARDCRGSTPTFRLANLTWLTSFRTSTSSSTVKIGNSFSEKSLKLYLVGCRVLSLFRKCFINQNLHEPGQKSWRVMAKEKINVFCGLNNLATFLFKFVKISRGVPKKFKKWHFLKWKSQHFLIFCFNKMFEQDHISVWYNLPAFFIQTFLTEDSHK